MIRHVKLLGIQCELRRPTADLACARSILDLQENQIKELADQGLFPVWNIAIVHPAQKSNRMERRFLTRALRDYAQGRTITNDDDFIETLIYGGRRTTILGRDFCRSWNCDSGHTCNLIRSGALQLVKGTDYSRGRGHTAQITWASAIAFLNSRRMA